MKATFDKRRAPVPVAKVEVVNGTGVLGRMAEGLAVAVTAAVFTLWCIPSPAALRKEVALAETRLPRAFRKAERRLRGGR